MRHSDKMMLVGSCFSDNIGAKLRDAMIDVVVNPFGTIFNPLSIASSLHKVIDNEVVAGADLFLANGVWSNFDFHSRFSMASKEAALERMNRSIEEAHEHLLGCKTLVITLGTAVVYRRRDTGEVVSNCHKVPQHEFTRRMAGVDEITKALAAVVSRLHEFNPELRVLFTVAAPFALVMHVPAAYILDKPLYGWPAWTAFVCPLAGAGVFAVMYLVFRRAMRHYRSTGS